jgi:hypothetical protein
VYHNVGQLSGVPDVGVRPATTAAGLAAASGHQPECWHGKLVGRLDVILNLDANDAAVIFQNRSAPGNEPIIKSHSTGDRPADAGSEYASAQ